MSQDRVGKPWTKEEDELLIQAVAIHGEVDNWKNVALSVPGRTNKACRKRWLHSLSPSVKKTAWTAEEDQLLLSLYATHGTKWSVIARHIPGRTDDACSKRYREALDPNLKKDEWTSEEDERLLQIYARLGGRWGQIGHELNRSGLACRNRWRLLQRRKAASGPQGVQQQPGPSVSSLPQRTSVQQISQPAWIPTLPEFDTSQLWNTHSTEYYDSSLYQPQQIPYTPSGFRPPVNPVGVPDGIHSGSSNSLPFQFSSTSSSLSAALSLSHALGNTGGTRNQPESPVPQGPSSLDGEPMQTTPRFSPEPQYQTPTTFDSCAQSSPAPPRSRDADIPQYQNSNDGLQQQNTEEPDSSQPAPSGLGAAEAEQEDSIPQEFHMPVDESYEDDPPTEITGPPSSRQESVQAPDSSAIAEQSQVDQPAPPDPSRHYRSEAQKSRAAVQQRKRKERSGPPPRLSSKLSVSSDLRAYACGHENCWPSNATSGSQCFTTSQELSDHWKVDHDSEIVNNKPFRCALAGCGKGWKSLNGLQYHLQVSKVHFQQALSASTNATASQEGSSAPSEDAPADSNGSKKKLFKCPHANCLHQYRQKSGLRYHLTHGHLNNNDTVPIQLDAVPPALARKVAQTQGVQQNATPASD